MSSPRSHVSDEHRSASNRLAQQYTFHLRAKSHSAPLPPTPNTTAKRPNLQPRSSSNSIKPSPLKMVSTTSPTSRHSHKDASSYSFCAESQPKEYGWMVPTVIEDDDLMFGGKSLSAWHEEGRQPVSPPEEEKRGRQRVSVCRSEGDVIMCPNMTCRYDNTTLTRITSQIRQRQAAASRRSTEPPSSRFHQRHPFLEIPIFQHFTTHILDFIDLSRSD